MTRLLTLLCMSILFFSCTSEGTKVEGSDVVIPKDGSTDLKTGGIMTNDGVFLNFLTIGNGRKTLIIPNAAYLVDDFRVLSNEFRIIFYDPRNRGRSQSIANADKLEAGIQNDVKDLEAIRQHFEVEQFSIIGQSDMALMAAIYALEQVNRVEKIVQMGAISPIPGKDYLDAAPHTDTLTDQLNIALQNLEAEKEDLSPTAYCEKWWELMRLNYTADGKNQLQVAKGICRYTNEHPDKLLAYQKDYIAPSIAKLSYSESDYGKIKAPVLTIHGTHDRISSIGASRDWVAILPNASLMEIDNGGHFPWIGNESVINSIRDFLK